MHAGTLPRKAKKSSYRSDWNLERSKLLEPFHFFFLEPFGPSPLKLVYVTIKNHHLVLLLVSSITALWRWVEISVPCGAETVRLYLQVAPHLLSEKEKMLLDQLVDRMVSYAITYKKLKPGPSPGGPRHDDLSDVLLLSYDPPIDDFISFKVSIFRF